MGKLIVHQDKVTDIAAMVALCPFKALEDNNGKLEINAGCKLCKLCVKKGQPGAMEFVEEEAGHALPERERDISGDHVGLAVDCKLVRDLL